MATGAMTTTTLDAFIPEIWSQEARLAAQNATRMAGIVTTKYDKYAQKGDTVHIPNIAAVSTGTKSGNSDVTYTTNTESTIDISLNQHKYFAFVAEDIVKIQTDMDLVTQYSAQGGRSLANVWDAAIASLIVNASVTQNVSSQASAGAAHGAITDAVIRSGIQLLDEANAPENDRYLVISPAQKNAMLGIDKFVNASTKGAGQTIVNGEFGNIYGVTVVVSNNLPDTTSVASSSGASAILGRKNCMLFQKEGLAFATQMAPRVQSAYNLTKLGDEVVGDIIYGTGLIVAGFCVQVRTTDEA